ncbi:MAG: hypothetical protein WB795_02190 [Candidatus Acidiferrales bacterium]
MTKTMTQGELSKSFEELRRGGIPLDDKVVESVKAASRGLSLYQTPSPVDSSIFDLDSKSGGAGYILSVAICNNTDRIIRPVACRLKTPWGETRLRWLEDPLRSVPREYSYSFPGVYGFEREAVLNHVLNRKTRLYPGDMFEGFLLGVGEECISEEYHNRRNLVTQFSVYDERGNRSDLDMRFLLWLFGRSRRHRSNPGPAQESKPLVEMRSEESCQGEKVVARRLSARR